MTLTEKDKMQMQRIIQRWPKINSNKSISITKEQAIYGVQVLTDILSRQNPRLLKTLPIQKDIARTLFIMLEKIHESFTDDDSVSFAAIER